MHNSIVSAFEEPNCTVCGGSTRIHEKWGTFHLNLLPPLQVSRCSNCGTLFLSPRPGPELRQALFEGNVPSVLQSYGKMTANYSAVTVNRKQTFEARVLELERLFKKKNPNPGHVSILDVGASAGTFVEVALKHGWNANGVEPSKNGVEQATAQGLPVEMGLAEQLPYPDESFDIVHSHHVYEHLSDPMKAAKEAFRVLKPGGLIFIEIPNQIDNIHFRRDVLFGKVHQRERNQRSIHHLWFFSTKATQNLLKNAGFRDVSVNSIFPSRPVGWARIPSAITKLIGHIYLGGSILQGIGYR